MAFYTPETGRGWVVEPIYTQDDLVSDRLALMAASADASGHSDIGARNLIYTTVVNLRPRRVLEIGTHIGSCSLVIGAALRLNKYGKLLTLEPQAHYQDLANANIVAAALTDHVEIVPYFSFDAPARERLSKEAPFEVIFIDGAHDYDAALNDIEYCASLLTSNGIMILHDVGRASATMDSSHKGGVRQALYDYTQKNPAAKTTYLEHPLWLNPCGVAMLSLQHYDPPIAAKRAEWRKWITGIFKN